MFTCQVDGKTRTIPVTCRENQADTPAPAETVAGFSDVPVKAFCAKPVEWAVQAGVTKGVNATTFDPDAFCTRGQIVTFLYRDLAD